MAMGLQNVAGEYPARKLFQILYKAASPLRERKKDSSQCDIRTDLLTVYDEKHFPAKYINSILKK